MIADEIQSGMARTGRYFASEHFDKEPNLVLSAKGIARWACPWPRSPAGPRSWTRRSRAASGGTFGGNPVACAAAIAVFEAIEEEVLLAEGERIEATLTAGLERLKREVRHHRRHPWPRRR